MEFVIKLNRRILIYVQRIVNKEEIKDVLAGFGTLQLLCNLPLGHITKEYIHAYIKSNKKEDGKLDNCV